MPSEELVNANAQPDDATRPVAVPMGSDATPGTKKRRLRARLLRYLWFLVIIYAAWCAAVYFAQSRLIFPRHFAGTGPKAPSSPDTEQWSLDIPANEKGVSPGKVEAWFTIGAGRSAANPGPAVMYFHGNGERIADVEGIARGYQRKGISVLLVEYRGYGNSGGEPSQAGILHDAIAFHTRLCERFEVVSGKVFFVGHSLGGGVACALAMRREPAALVLECTFTSVASFAHTYLVPERLVKNPFRNDEALLGVTAPLLLAHGRNDTLIPMSHSMTLARIRPDAIFIELPGGHLDFPGDPKFYDKELTRFLTRQGLLDAATP